MSVNIYICNWGKEGHIDIDILRYWVFYLMKTFGRGGGGMWSY